MCSNAVAKQSGKFAWRFFFSSLHELLNVFLFVIYFVCEFVATFGSVFMFCMQIWSTSVFFHYDVVDVAKNYSTLTCTVCTLPEHVMNTCCKYQCYPTNQTSRANVGCHPVFLNIDTDHDPQIKTATQYIVHVCSNVFVYLLCDFKVITATAVDIKASHLRRGR